MVEEKNFRKGKLLGKYMAKMLWIEWQKVWKRVFEKVGEELVKIEDSFSRKKTLKGG